jgi:amidase
MISFDDYARHDATGLADLVRRRDVSAAELLEAAISRAEAVNPKLNAIVIPMHDLARERARGSLEGPLAGVPFLVKDLFQDYAGVPATSGCNAWKRAGFKPAEHGEIVRRWLRAGLVVFGRTNTPEFGSKGTTEPVAWGPTRNPWDTELSPGGSSGGSAAAVAAGVVPAAGANDGGGSIRIPSAATGLFGLKPGRGRTPSGPRMGEAIHGAAVHHVLSRSVRDSAALLDATHGTERGSLCRLAPPDRPYVEEVGRDPRRLRVAFTVRSPLGTDVDPAAVAAVEATARMLEGAGHLVAPAEPAIDGTALARDFTRIWFAHLAVHLKHAREELRGRDADFETDSLAMEAVARARSAMEYAETYQRWVEYSAKLADFFANHDVYMTPTLALPPQRIGAVQTPKVAAGFLRASLAVGAGGVIPLASGLIERLTLENLRGVPFTQLANVTGVPAMSVPLHTYPNGLPLGIQFVADHGGEGMLLSLAGQLERLAPWAARRPAI